MNIVSVCVCLLKKNYVLHEKRLFCFTFSQILSILHLAFLTGVSAVQQWQKVMEEKLSPLFSLKEVLSEEDAAKMGRKDPEEEVEKFVSANTQELGKDKWLCPLSGKKFKVLSHVSCWLVL